MKNSLKSFPGNSVTLLCTVIILISLSCAGTKKKLKTSQKPASENVVSTPEVREPSESVAPIKEIEEKLVPIDEVKPNPDSYFVIIGSFLNPDNAKKYQTQIKKDGFNSEILKNEEGLYRVSVLATNEINVARDEIRRIRSSYPKYFDTWLLIQKK